MTAALPPVKALFVVQQAAHYRRDVYRLLYEADGFECRFLVGAPPRFPSIPSISPSDLGCADELHNRWIGPLLWQAGLMRILLRYDYQVVVFEGDAHYLSTWLGALIVRCRRRTALYWTIGWTRPERGLKKWVRLLFYSLANGLLLYGDHGRAIGEAIGYPPKRLAVIGNSVSTSQQQKTDRVTNRIELPPTNEKTIGAVIRLTPIKRLDLVIRAASILRHEGLKVNVLLVGGGPEAGPLRSLADELGVSLYMPGPVYDASDLEMVYSHLDLTVVPSHIGLTVLQSLYFGVPAISHDDLTSQVPEVAAIVPDVTGDLYRHGDLADLVNTIRSWLSLSAEEKDGVATACKVYHRNHWSSEAHANKIIAGITTLAGFDPHE